MERSFKELPPLPDIEENEGTDDTVTPEAPTISAPPIPKGNLLSFSFKSKAEPIKPEKTSEQISEQISEQVAAQKIDPKLLKNLDKLKALELLNDKQILENIEKLNGLIKPKAPTWQRYCLKAAYAFMDLVKVVSFSALVFYALSFEQSRNIASRALSLLEFGSSARSNFALNILAEENNSKQMAMAYDLVKERAELGMESFLQGSTSSKSFMATHEDQLSQLKEIFNLKFKSGAFDLSSFISERSGELLAQHKARLSRLIKYESEKNLLGRGNKMAALKQEAFLAEGRYQDALVSLEGISAPSSRVFPLAKRIAQFALIRKAHEDLIP